ncbi:MAG: hypothetical protein WHU54_04590 [Candidatus Bathyarchaeia archaeon]
MGCWKWFNSVLKEAGVQVTEKNKDAIDQVIHDYVSEQLVMAAARRIGEKPVKKLTKNLK